MVLVANHVRVRVRDSRSRFKATRRSDNASPVGPKGRFRLPSRETEPPNGPKHRGPGPDGLAQSRLISALNSASQFSPGPGAETTSPGRFVAGVFLNHPSPDLIDPHRQEHAGLEGMVLAVVPQPLDQPFPRSPTPAFFHDFGRGSMRRDQDFRPDLKIGSEDDGARTRNLRRDRPVL